MAAEAQETPLAARSGKPPDSTPSLRRGKVGQRPDSYYRQPTQVTLNMTAPRAARMLEDHIWQVKGYRDIKLSLQRACEFVIEHSIGKARQKIEHSGAVLTYGEVSKSAENLAKKGRDVLADAEAIKDGYAGSDGVPTTAAKSDSPDV